MEKKNQKQKLHQVIGIILSVFGLFIIMSAFAVFPSDSSWGSIYAIIGCIIFSCGVFKLCTVLRMYKVIPRIVCSVASFIILFLGMCFLDYMGAKNFDQPPRFCYVKIYGEDSMEYKTFFYSVTRYHVDEDDEYYVFH